MKLFFRAFLLVSVLAMAPRLRAVDAIVDVNKPKSFSESKTIIVPTVYLKLPIAGKVFVAKQGSALSTIGGGNANSVKASAHYTVNGLDKKLAQELAAKVYDDFVAKLQAAGYTVKTYKDIAETDVIKGAQLEKMGKDGELPTEKDPSGNAVYMIATPSDAQLFKQGLVGGVFNQFMKAGKNKFQDGSILIPTYTIAAPQAWGETGGGYKRISAEVNVAPGMNLNFAIAQLLTPKGGWGDVRLKSAIVNTAENVGELKKQDKTPNTANAVSSALSFLSGAGKITSSSANYELTINPQSYETGLLAGTGAFNEQVATASAGK